MEAQVLEPVEFPYTAMEAEQIFMRRRLRAAHKQVVLLRDYLERSDKLDVTSERLIREILQASDGT